MPNTPNIESANNGGFLWPPIADALDTFLRRRHNDADAYEQVWRLIHVWEAVEITLAVAAMARVRQDKNSAELLRRQREFFYGKSWDQVTQSFKSMQGAADGGIDQWISILDEVAKSKDLDGRFLPALRDFLKCESIQMGSLLTAWAKACDVPPDFKRQDAVEVRQAMRYVNSFRNRFAHVPFPHDRVHGKAETAAPRPFSRGGLAHGGTYPVAACLPCYRSSSQPFFALLFFAASAFFSCSRSAISCASVASAARNLVRTSRRRSIFARL